MKQESDNSNSLPAEDIPENLSQTDAGLLSMILWHISIVWNFLMSCVLQLIFDIGLCDMFDNMAVRAVQHPFITLSIAITVLSVGLPLLAIAIFVFSTVVMTFTGFVLLEGTLISISSVLLFGCLGAILIVFLFFVGVTLAGYFGFLHIYDLYYGAHNKSAITDYLQRERRSVS